MKQINNPTLIHYTCKKKSIWKYDTTIFLGEEVIAELRFNSMKTKAALITDSGSWTLERSSVFSNEFSVFSDKTQEEVAYLESFNLYNYRLRLRYEPDVRIQLGRKVSLWNFQYQWEDAFQRPLILFKQKMEWTGYKTEITVYAEDCIGLDVPFLCGVGLYVTMIMRMYSSAAT